METATKRPGYEPRAASRDRLAGAAIVASTLLWGTLWIPLRKLDAAGLGGAWATTASLLLPALVLLPIGAARRRRLVAGGRPLLAAGVSMALCIALYSEGLLRGQVARVILLFYLTPVWSTLLARFLLGVPITGRRVLTIVLGLAGMLTVFGFGAGPPLPQSAAEWMGLVSGFCWGWAMVYLRKTEAVAEIDKMIVYFAFVGAVFFALSLIPGGRTWTLPDAAALYRSSGWLLALGLLWMPGVIWLTMFGGSRIDPGRVAVLLMLEIVIGLLSAAALTDEPFGARDMLGALLILSACASEGRAAGPLRPTAARFRLLPRPRR